MLTFLGWGRPLIELGAEHLVKSERRAVSGGLLDLGNTLVIVPTQNSGRRLREYLAGLMGESRAGLLPPSVMTPESLLDLGVPDDLATASGLTAQLTWATILQDLDFARYRELFPVDPVSRNAAWALGIAGDLHSLRQTLGEKGLEISDVADTPRIAEPGRWRNLAELEKRYHSRLKEAQLVDLQQARKRFLEESQVPAGVNRVVVLGVSDPVPLALDVLKVLARKTPTEICVFAPDEEASTFDDWGIPDEESWSRRHLEIPEMEQSVHLVASPSSAADTVMQFLRASEEPGETSAVGMLDPEAGALIENACARENIPCYLPSGSSLGVGGVRHLLACLLEFLRMPEVRSFSQLVRCPDVLAWISERYPDEFQTAALPGQLDKIHGTHLPAELGELEHFAGRREEWSSARIAVTALTSLLDRCTGESENSSPAELLRAVPADLLSARSHPGDAPALPSIRSALELAGEVADLLESPVGISARIDFPDALDLFLRALSQTPLYSDRPPGSVEFLGWLELFLEDSPHLILLGLNDGIVPESVTSDPYLPEPLRAQLGLKTNEARFARDAYYLTTMIESRRQSGGQVDILITKTNRAGDPLRPSRLLFQCPREELPERTKRLFRDVPHTGENVPWHAAWKLQPGFDKKPSKLSATAIKNYLECPFRFYLSNVLRMEPIDPKLIELDARGFGSLAHDILEAYGLDQGINTSTDSSEIDAYFQEAVRKRADATFGRHRSVPLNIQIETIRRRLSAAAFIEARERAQGWLIEKVEHKFHFEMDGSVITGIIDRIERNKDTGAIRIIDFKTRDKGDAPKKAHCSSITASTDTSQLRDYALFDLGGKPHRWKDLQLPLYALALEFEDDYSDADLATLQAGYFQLPKALDETRLDFWSEKEFNAELLEAARTCVAGILADINASRFWPPAEKVPYENYESLLFGNPLATVEEFSN